jgi:hypothetical protein
LVNGNTETRTVVGTDAINDVKLDAALVAFTTLDLRAALSLDGTERVIQQRGDHTLCIHTETEACATHRNRHTRESQKACHIVADDEALEVTAAAKSLVIKQPSEQNTPNALDKPSSLEDLFVLLRSEVCILRWRI